MSTYQRMIAMEAEPARVFEYLRDPKHAQMFARIAGSQSEVPLRIDTEGQRLDWTGNAGENYNGSIWLRQGDATPEITEVTMQMDMPGRPEDDARGEQVLEAMQQALETIRREVR